MTDREKAVAVLQDAQNNPEFLEQMELVRHMSQVKKSKFQFVFNIIIAAMMFALLAISIWGLINSQNITFDVVFDGQEHHQNIDIN